MRHFKVCYRKSQVLKNRGNLDGLVYQRKTEDEYLNHTAGIKAREDLEAIWKNHGMQEIHMVVGNDNREDGNLIQKLNRHINKKNIGRNNWHVQNQGTLYIYNFQLEIIQFFYLQF